MRTAILTLLLLCATAAAREPEDSTGGRAFVEIESARRSYYVEEPIRITVRFGLDRRFFRTNAVPLFAREVDLPVQVLAPWIDELAGTVARPDPDPPPAGSAPTFVLNTRLVGATVEEDRVVDDRPYRVSSFTRTFLAVEPGELVVPAPEVRFAYGTEFEDDFLNGRRARDRKEVVVRGMPLRLEIKPLPDPRPETFSGAVGSLRHGIDISPREVEVGESMKLTFTVTGEGNLERFDTPPLDLAGFHVYGVIDELDNGVRTFVYDLAPVTGGITELPPVPFSFFDPSSGTYLTLRTPPIPLVVHGDPAPAAATQREEPDGDSAAVWIAVLAASFTAVLVVLLAARRGMRKEPVDRDEERAVAAATDFEARLDGPDPDLAAVFAEYLSARLRAPTASLIGPDLAERLGEAGAPRDLAARTASHMEELVAVRYGGDTYAGDAAAGRALVAELEVVFHREA